jgi:hypothetical protein
VERYIRQADDTWVLTAFSDIAQTFSFESIRAQIALTDIYRGVTVPDSGA